MEADRHEVTRILRALDLSDRSQAEELLALVYDELRAVAARQLRRERPDHTLQPTALVHEAYLRLVDAPDIGWEGRAHFFGCAARAMRQILVDHARRRGAHKRGGGWERVTLREAVDDADPFDAEILDLHSRLSTSSRSTMKSSPAWSSSGSSQGSPSTKPPACVGFRDAKPPRTGPSPDCGCGAS